MENIITKIYKQPEKIIFGLEKLGLLDWMCDEKYLKLVYKLTFRRKLDLENPQAFTEKINWYKLNYRNPLMKKCVDKYEVRDYIAKIGGERYLNDCLGIWNNFDEIDFEKLPSKFVLKPTNGSGDVVICKDKSKFNILEAKKKLSQNKKRHFLSKTREWAYYDLPYRIMAERYIESTDGCQIKDYKIFCFNGEPKFLYVASDRDTDKLKFDFFDLDWNRIPVKNDHENNSNLKKPKHLKEMLEVAKKLSKDFPEVRVDLYEEEGKIYFGELTFYHMGGFARFEPDEWDYKFGEYFDIKRI